MRGMRGEGGGWGVGGGGSRDKMYDIFVVILLQNTLERRQTIGDRSAIQLV